MITVARAMGLIWIGGARYHSARPVPMDVTVPGQVSPRLMRSHRMTSAAYNGCEGNRRGLTPGRARKESPAGPASLILASGQMFFQRLATARLCGWRGTTLIASASAVQPIPSALP